MASKSQSIQVGPLRKDELPEAGRIVRLAFGTFLGLPNPLEFMDDRDFMTPRWHARNTAVLAAREGRKLIASNVITRWGSFGFFGPLTVLPEYWSRGVAQQLLAATVKVFNRWGVRHTGLFTFASSPKHVGLYQKFGYWPGSLTALMKYAPQPSVPIPARNAKAPVHLSALSLRERKQAIAACAALAGTIGKGLDLSDEIRAVLVQHTGEVILTYGQRSLDAFAICMNGAGTEGGTKTCYIKFAAARGGSGAEQRFTRLLEAVEALALTREAEVEAGVNLACEEAYCRMQSRGYRAFTLGVAMHCPRGSAFTRAGAYVLGDWR